MLIDDQIRTADRDAQALIEQARRRQRRRRRFVAGGSVLGLVTALCSYIVVDHGGRGPAAGHTTTASKSSLAAPGNATYQDCPGTGHVGPKTAPDFLPAATDQTNSLHFVRTVARNDAALNHRLYKGITAIRPGPGGGYVWTRDSAGKVVVIHVKNYGLYLYLAARANCPSPTGGAINGTDEGVQMTFLYPKG